MPAQMSGYAAAMTSSSAATVKLHLIVAYYKGQDRDRELPSVIDVWDDMCVADNWEGYQSAVQKAVGEHGDPRLLMVEIPERALTGLWDVPTVQGSATPAGLPGAD